MGHQTAPSSVLQSASDQHGALQHCALSDKERRILRAVLQNWPLRSFPKAIGISSSAGNKELRKTWQRLGLKSREQLLFVAGYLRLLDLDSIR